ncbi:DUF4127 family protein [Microbacterium sp. zg.Y909]|uniref:DUF4127 family protein n=1 Tax=Microbacterium sp. zg.Y909 TaxID=2969413 RepID=UPI00214CB347|nr:DUF4127 family protein [Microbacterium sp. zg.Y909]MCR2824966.1 DUF4127 family protein [Microbacterium sp. zg.Y909]
MTAETRIALIPLDERPVNTVLVEDVAAIAGANLELPPADALPSFRDPADVRALDDWALAMTDTADAFVVSVDTLVHGGLIPGRLLYDTPAEALQRLDVLRQLRARMGQSRRISAVSVVGRASDSYVSFEEPSYWAQYGRDLHALGGNVHRAWRGMPSADTKIPHTIRDDFARRRLRNHIVNAAALGLRWERVIDILAITADDTAQWSAGSAEQEIIDYWGRLGSLDGVLVHPGADETGAVLVARELAHAARCVPLIDVRSGNDAEMDRIPLYENVPVRDSIERQIAAVGGARAIDRADFVLLVHTPDPDSGDLVWTSPTADAEAVAATTAAIERALETELPVVVADLRYANGGDQALVEELARRGLLSKLAGYSAWNTAGNALGSALAFGVAIVAGQTTGSLDATAVARARTRRILDDVGYQAHLRSQLVESTFGGLGPVGEETASAATEAITEGLRRSWLPLADPMNAFWLGGIELPWRRSFEIDLRLEAAKPTPSA